MLVACGSAGAVFEDLAGIEAVFPKGDQLRDRTGYVVVSLPQTQAVVLEELAKISPAVAFPVTSAGAFMEIPRGVVAHLVATAGADCFVFFSVTSPFGLPAA